MHMWHDHKVGPDYNNQYMALQNTDGISDLKHRTLLNWIGTENKIAFLTGISLWSYALTLLLSLETMEKE